MRSIHLLFFDCCYHDCFVIAVLPMPSPPLPPSLPLLLDAHFKTAMMIFIQMRNININNVYIICVYYIFLAEFALCFFSFFLYSSLECSRLNDAAPIMLHWQCAAYANIEEN